MLHIFLPLVIVVGKICLMQIPSCKFRASARAGNLQCDDDVEILSDNLGAGTIDNIDIFLPRDIDLLNALTWLNYFNDLNGAYRSPWVMVNIEKSGLLSRLSSRSGAVNEELYNLVAWHCRYLIECYG